MMRNSINSYLTSLVMVLALLLSANAFATETVQSTIEIDGKDYALFTGFNAIKGVAGTNADPESSKMVDGDIESLWNVVLSLSGEYASVEFSSDYPIILRGFIVNLYNTTASRHPTELRLYAKASETDEYVEVSSYSVPSYLDMERTFPITKEDNTMYRYFKFECANSGRNMKLTEIRLYGYKEWAYTYLTPQEATCTQQGVLKECYRRTDGKYFADELGVTELTAEECVTPALPHEGVHHEEEANYIEYWQCSVCGHFFSDAKMTAEITEVQTQKISYMNSSGDLVQLNEVATKVTSDTTIWNAGWYLVSENVTISDRIIVNGEVHLILADGVTLNANRGITVSTDASFNIYAQTEDEANMGVLNATAPNHLGNPYAGIGCAYGSGDAGSITINGGKITARGFIGAGIGSVQYRSVGTITINGGIVDAADTEGSGAGIGSGNLGKASVINLNGGVIYAKGIGAGNAGTGYITINISNGIKKIVATSNNSGCIGNKENITVNFKNEGSIVTGAVKDAIFYDSGEGEQRNIRIKALCHHIAISDDLKAHITADIEYALAGERVALTIVGSAVDAASIKVNGGTVPLLDAGNNTYTFEMPEIDVNVTAEVAKTYSVSLPDNMEIISTSNPADGEGKYIAGTIIKFKPVFLYEASNVSDGTNILNNSDGVYAIKVEETDINITATISHNNNINLSDAPYSFTAVNADVLSGRTYWKVTIADGATITLSNATINGGIVCEGTATIILDGDNNVKSYSMNAGIQVGGAGTTLVIKGSGSLVATGAFRAAGIGLSAAWDVEVVGGNIVVEGGNITVVGGEDGAGIGTGVSNKIARLGDITIKSGTVKAIGGSDGGFGTGNIYGIGVGNIVSRGTNEIGTITIYDTVDLVDASSIGKDIIYMHDNTDVSESKNDYFTIIENGERKIIYTGNPISDIEDQTYTGEAITPKPIVSLGSLNFEEGTDYEYSYTNNVKVGSSATVTVTFKGDYAEFGSVSKSFNITKATPTVEPPTSANPKFAGNCVELVNPGITDFGVILYSIKEDEGYSSDIPCANAAGNYKIYYKVEERDNWSSVEGSVDVTVENEKFTVTFVDAEGETISSGKYPYGTPVVDIAKPTGNPEKADDEMYAYTFAGWSPEIQEVTDAKTYSPIYNKTRIGFGSATIAADGSWATIDGKSSKKIDADLDAVEITGDVTLNREFVAEKPSTIVLPFDTHIDNVPGFTFYSFKGVVKENGVWKKVVFDEVDKEGDGHIYANTPYIVVAKEDVGGLIVENGVVFDLNSVRPMSSEDGIWQFVGTYDFKVWNEGDRYIGRSYGFAAEERDGARIGQFVMLGSNAYAYPMRAYLYYAGGNSGESRSMAPALFKAAPAVASIDELPESMDVVIRGEEGTTVIGTINTRTGEFRSAENRWFDLNGRFLGNKKPTVKGTYYNNGKKVIVK
ncbi:MAG: hypothetical protein MJY87_06665 [Fibrobacter sp.]|nr:hypothetical protein [Fibrobacter sp.]